MFEPPTQTGVDDVHAHPRHVGHRWFDLLLALVAIFISGVSLYVAVEHGRTERELVRENAQLVQAGSWPFLQIDGEYSTRSPTRITLVNAGVGPAKLERFQVLYRGRPVVGVEELLERCCGLPTDQAARRVLLPDGLMIADPTNNVIRAGQERPVLRVDATPDRHALADAFLKASPFIGYRACWCSVFDACWVGDLASLRPQPVARCPTDWGRDFNRGAT